ncbi:aldehyde dehydrogenase family protein [Microbacterium sp. CPCC 204701]|uniref:aldehyde dehydrogenase family protein n=1 Tax=Microbacterium sp. CPCC 204701 TaxID=2493084 RepID=UPI000FD706C8|nr:aldehyde dehydrogenase family protein [Microbacterium sp. CPCC 204701]
MRNVADGVEVGTDAGREVEDPATLEVVDSVEVCAPEGIDQTVRAARAAFPGWAASGEDRQAALTRVSAVLASHEDELAILLSREQGKPLAQAYQEFRGSRRILDWYAALADADEILRETPEERVLTKLTPIGVVGMITPWNFPITILGMKLWATLRAGNTTVIKPASTTPLSTLRMVQLIAEVLPPGVVNTVTGSGAVGQHLASHPLVDKVSFTGSTEVGREVMRAATPGLKRLTLELGGNDPAILLDDVDLDAALPMILRSAFHNAGQVCQAIKRVMVPRHLYGDVVDGLVTLANESFVVGRGLTEGVTMGPVNNFAQRETVRGLVADARKRGAIVHTVGRRIDADLPGYFLMPTIVAGVEADWPLAATEQFGPSLPLVAYDDLDRTIADLNAGEFGLDASVWGRDEDAAIDASLRLEVGQSFVNTHAGPPDPLIPFGGVKGSGFGRELGLQGLEEASQLRVLKVHRASVPATVGR